MHAIPKTALSVVSTICFVILIVALTALIAYLIFAGREKRIAFLKSYKYGKFALIYVVALPMYLVGHLYLQTELNFFSALFSAIDKVAALVVLMYKMETIEGITYTWYWINMYFIFTLVAVNAVLFVLSLTSQRLWQFWQKIKSKWSKKQKLYIFGYNDDSLAIYDSSNGGFKTIVNSLSKEDSEKLYIKKISYISAQDECELLSKLLKGVKPNSKPCTVILNTEDDEKNIRLCRHITAELNALPEEKRSLLFGIFGVYTFGNPSYEEIYEDIVDSGFGCVHYVNKYRKIAIDFIDKYPFTRFMDERQIDYSTSLIRDGVEVNVCMLGFGKINRQIFLTSVANNQFLKKGKGDPELKPVNYYIFDKNEDGNYDKSFNHNYYRYDLECDFAHPEKYLPLPARPANEKYIQMDINDKALYGQIRKIFSRSTNDANFLIIAFGSELENIDMARRLIEKRKEWGVGFEIFVKARSIEKDEILNGDSNCHFIGNNRAEVFNIGSITADKIYKMGHMRDDSYNLEGALARERKENQNFEITKHWIDKTRSDFTRHWYKTMQVKRESNLYCCLSLKFKLNLMGLDYCKKDEEGVGLTEEEYLKIYADGDMPVTTAMEKEIASRKIVKYDINFKQSRRKTMAICEHYRWNSFYLSKGFVPATREQIEKEYINGEFTNGRNEPLRRHGCLTTFEGLVEFRRIRADRDGGDEANYDVIKYDYQLLDDAWWLLDETGYKIINKKGRA